MKQETTKPAAQAQVRELTDAELEQVSGGTIVLEELTNQKKVGRSTLEQPNTTGRAGKKLLIGL